MIFANTHPITKIAYKHDNYIIGHAFEDYIVTLFSKRSFKLIEWRSDKKASNGVFPFSCCWPDLEFETAGRKRKRFAIECKWRKSFYYSGIDWATNSQILKYREYQKQNNIFVYVAIGVGGLPSNPEMLFITPLDHIYMYPRVFRSHLFPFKRNTKQLIEFSKQLEIPGILD